MLPPVLEIYVVWHPLDAEGAVVAREIIDHFHGTAFSGLIGGAVEVFTRSQGWNNGDDAPRPLPFMEALPNGVAAPELVAVVPVLGRKLAFALEDGHDAWDAYIQAIADAHNDESCRVRAFPVALDHGVVSGTRLGAYLGDVQHIGDPSTFVAEPAPERRIRDLAQALAQFAARSSGQQIRVFVSHTKRYGDAGAERLHALIERTRALISNTRLAQFFDENAIQAGANWVEELRTNAATGALLALRTDLYATREWCQDEVRTAKLAGVPVVILDALDEGEERGSFLMDHVPRIPGGAEPGDQAIIKALNQLVDECLKRALWMLQHQLASGRTELGVAWWAPHAPEPLTLAAWLRENTARGSGPVRILHPDPPLGPAEIAVLADLAAIAGIEDRLEVMTPRGLAARGA
jgi:hypothetical protein